jgi:hypothetical protein
MVEYREGQVQRRVQKTTGSGKQPAKDDEAVNSDTLYFPSQIARTYVPKKKGRTS